MSPDSPSKSMAAAAPTISDLAPAGPAPDEHTTLRAEVARLRDLVGPDEVAYVKLRTELWAARDAAMGAELSAGTLRGRVLALESQLVRTTRQSRYLKRLAISPLRKAKDFLRNV